MTRTAPGSAARTRTPTVSCASTSPRERTSAGTTPTNSPPSLPRSTAVLVKHSDGGLQQRPSMLSYTRPISINAMLRRPVESASVPATTMMSAALTSMSTGGGASMVPSRRTASSVAPVVNWPRSCAAAAAREDFVQFGQQQRLASSMRYDAAQIDDPHQLRAFPGAQAARPCVRLGSLSLIVHRRWPPGAWRCHQAPEEQRSGNEHHGQRGRGKSQRHDRQGGHGHACPTRDVHQFQPAQRPCFFGTGMRQFNPGQPRRKIGLETRRRGTEHRPVQ